MNLDLNLISGITVGLMAACGFSLDIVSSPKESKWWTLPPIIRWQVRITAAWLMVRSVNFFGMVGMPSGSVVVGQASWLTVGTSFWMALTILSLTLYGISNKLPAKAWDRIRFVMQSMRRQPDSVPVMLSKDQVLDAHHASGQPAVDGARPESVERESGRAGRQAARLSA